jgi:hypothetical protein
MGLFVYTKVQFFKIKQTAGFISCCSSVVEHLLGKEEVGGSIPLNSSKQRRRKTNKLNN